ncbi:MAG TPA: hypothetical protein VH640_28995 [Bryobacteraceae bacterium]|jgi:chromosome segregation ATPase
MTIDERLEKLMESIEAMRAAGAETDKRLDRLAQRHEALAESVELLRASETETDRKFSEVAALFRQTDEFIRTLAEIAKRHEERLDALDGGK